jgi:hypothetical protein
MIISKHSQSIKLFFRIDETERLFQVSTTSVASVKGKQAISNNPELSPFQTWCAAAPGAD